MNIIYEQIEIITIDNIKTWDYPKFCDAYISEANYFGKPMSDKMLDELNDNHKEFILEQIHNYIN